MTIDVAVWLIALALLVLLSWLRGLREDEERERNRLRNWRPPPAPSPSLGEEVSGE